MKDTIDILVKDAPKSLNKKLKVKAVKTDKTVSLIIIETLKEKFNKQTYEINKKM